MDLTANEMVYDNNTSRIYATIPSSNGSNGNSIGIIDPQNFELERTVFMGSEPNVIAIADDGSYVYVGFEGSSTIRRFDIQKQEAGLQFSLGADEFSGSFYAEDIEVMPGQPQTIAVSLRNAGFSPKHEGVAIFDNDIKRPVNTADHTGSNQIEFTSATSIIGYNNESTEYGLRRHAINESGVTTVSVSPNILSGFYLKIAYHKDKIYAFDGKVVDIKGAPFVKGQYPMVNGPVAFDDSQDQVTYASYDVSGAITLKRFDATTFLLEDSTAITGAYGQVKSMVSCGNGCYAFNTTDHKVVLVKDTTLSNATLNSDNRLWRTLHRRLLCRQLAYNPIDG